MKKCQGLDDARRELVALKHSEDAQMHKTLLIFYYTGLKYLNSKFQFKLNDSDAVSIAFTWRDSLTGQEYTSSEGLELEMNSILFNLAAVMNNIGSTIPITADSIKTVSMEFQSAAWIYDHMCKTLEKLDSDLRGLDFRSDNLKRLMNLQLAQSQYCFFKKAEIAEMKPGLISKVAKQVYDYFRDSDGHSKASLKSDLEKY